MSKLLPEDVARLEKELATLDYIIPDKTQTIKEILKSKGDTCWGVSRLIRERLRRAGLDPETVYWKEEETDGITPTHQFNTFRHGDDYRVMDYRVDNHSMFPYIGPRYKSREEAIERYLDAWRKEQGSFLKNVDIYSGKYIPRPGKDFDEYMNAIEKGNKFLKQYPAMEKSSSVTRADPSKFKYLKNFQRIVKKYKDKYGIDLSHIKYEMDTVARNSRGDYVDIPNNEFGGNWMKNHTISINPNLKDVVKHYNLDMTTNQFANQIIGHELAHDIEANPKYKALVKQFVEEAKANNFTTPYLDNVSEDKMNKELFCEYMSYLVNNGLLPRIK